MPRSQLGSVHSSSNKTIMKQQLSQIILLLMCMISMASPGQECPPKSITTEDFPPEKFKGIYRVKYCNSRVLCDGVKCQQYTVKSKEEKKDEFYLFSSIFNISSGKLEESLGTLKFNGPGRYLIKGIPDTPPSEFYAIAFKPKYLIEYSCLPNEKGELQGASWISSRDNAELSDEDICEIKERLKQVGLSFEEYRKADNEDCDDVDELTPASKI